MTNNTAAHDQLKYLNNSKESLVIYMKQIHWSIPLHWKYVTSSLEKERKTRREGDSEETAAGWTGLPEGVDED